MSKRVYLYNFCGPNNRTKEHNMEVQTVIEASEGADVSSSLSVLNVIEEYTERIKHIQLLFHATKVNGIVFFKVWAGSWPLRGTGQTLKDTKRNVFQANHWASDFASEVESVFGNKNVIVDNNLNLLIARKT